MDNDILISIKTAHAISEHNKFHFENSIDHFKEIFMLENLYHDFVKRAELEYLETTNMILIKFEDYLKFDLESIVLLVLAVVVCGAQIVIMLKIIEEKTSPQVCGSFDPPPVIWIAAFTCSFVSDNIMLG